MNRFIIVDGLPYLCADGRTYAVRWNEKGFSVGAEVKLASAPALTYSEISVKAKCAGNLDSIGDMQSVSNFENMKVDELKEYASKNNIDLNGAKMKDDIIKAIKAAAAQGGGMDDNDS